MTPTVTETAVFTALRAFLVGILPQGVEVVRSQDNRVPEPAGPDHVLMTPLDRQGLATTVTTWDFADAAADHLDNELSTQLDVQLDIYGPSASDNAQVIATLFRSMYATERFADGRIVPLFATDGHQAPMVNGEEQYENRWTMRVSLQISPTVSTQQDFAGTLAPTFRPVGGS